MTTSSGEAIETEKNRGNDGDDTPAHEPAFRDRASRSGGAASL